MYKPSGFYALYQNRKVYQRNLNLTAAGMSPIFSIGRLKRMAGLSEPKHTETCFSNKNKTHLKTKKPIMMVHNRLLYLERKYFMRLKF